MTHFSARAGFAGTLLGTALLLASCSTGQAEGSGHSTSEAREEQQVPVANPDEKIEYEKLRNIEFSTESIGMLYTGGDCALSGDLFFACLGEEGSFDGFRPLSATTPVNPADAPKMIAPVWPEEFGSIDDSSMATTIWELEPAPEGFILTYSMESRGLDATVTSATSYIKSDGKTLWTIDTDVEPYVTEDYVMFSEHKTEAWSNVGTGPTEIYDLTTGEFITSMDRVATPILDEGEGLRVWPRPSVTHLIVNQSDPAFEKDFRRQNAVSNEDGSSGFEYRRGLTFDFSFAEVEIATSKATPVTVKCDVAAQNSDAKSELYIGNAYVYELNATTFAIECPADTVYTDGRDGGEGVTFARTSVGGPAVVEDDATVLFRDSQRTIVTEIMGDSRGFALVAYDERGVELWRLEKVNPPESMTAYKNVLFGVLDGAIVTIDADSGEQLGLTEPRDVMHVINAGDDGLLATVERAEGGQEYAAATLIPFKAT